MNNFEKLITLHRRWNEYKHSLLNKVVLHPVVYIYVWIVVVLSVQILSARALPLLLLAIIVFVIKICSGRFLMLLRRTRWILISLFVIYAYVTPGAALFPQLGVFSPVTEGLLDGLLQLMRLVTVLASLSILLTLLSQAQLITGLYVLFRPLIVLGISREQIAVRLALTLHYAEKVISASNINWRENFERQLEPLSHEPGDIELPVSSFSGLDLLMLVLASAALLGVVL